MFHVLLQMFFCISLGFVIAWAPNAVVSFLFIFNKEHGSCGLCAACSFCKKLPRVQPLHLLLLQQIFQAGATQPPVLHLPLAVWELCYGLCVLWPPGPPPHPDSAAGPAPAPVSERQLGLLSGPQQQQAEEWQQQWHQAPRQGGLSMLDGQDQRHTLHTEHRPVKEFLPIPT